MVGFALNYVSHRCVTANTIGKLLTLDWSLARVRGWYMELWCASGSCSACSICVGMISLDLFQASIKVAEFDSVVHCFLQFS